MTLRLKILCVDDEPQILKLFEAILTPEGYEVIKAQNGQEALEKLKDQWIDLVILDVKMPKMDGFEVCRRVKEYKQPLDIPVVLVTGLTAKEDRIKGIEAGAEDFISKPIEPAEVLARIRMLLKVQSIHERRIGDLFVQMGFITEEDLEEGLTFAKDMNINISDALYLMGALDRDHIYWALSKQLHMNYIELSPEMIDEELIKRFSIRALEELRCLPLYETEKEIHFAIADPTDRKILRKVRSLRSEKTLHLHLALPGKITDILCSFNPHPDGPEI